jgi:hypothetical protein
MEKKRFMEDLEEISIKRNDEILIAIAKKGNFSLAIEEIVNREDAEEIIREILIGKPHSEEILAGLKPHYGTKGLKSILEQTGKIIGEENFNQGLQMVEIMESYAGQIDVCGIARDIEEISSEMKDITLLSEVFEKYKNLEGKEAIIQSLQSTKNDLFEKNYLEIIEGWKSDYIYSIVRNLQNKRGLSPTIDAIKYTAKKIQKKEAMEEIAILSNNMDYENRFDKMRGLINIILFKGDEENFQKILDLGKKANKESIYQLGQIALWTENKKMYDELLDLSYKKDISYELSRLEGVAYYNNQKILEDNFNVLKNYFGKPESKRIMKKVSRISILSDNEFVSKYVSKLAVDYKNNSKRDKYLAEIQRYCHNADFEKVKNKLIEYNRPLRPENLENKLKKFIGNFNKK